MYNISELHVILITLVQILLLTNKMYEGNCTSELLILVLNVNHIYNK